MKRIGGPLILIFTLFFGIALGSFYSNHFGGNKLNIIGLGTNNKLTNLLKLIEDQYVDTVNLDSIVESTIPQVLSALDPHSIYLDVARAEAESEALHGSFFGIGVEFTIREDTIRIQNVISNGPAERAGMIAGDKIVKVDDETFVGSELTNENVMRRLKGEKDTKVKISVLRFGTKEPIDFTITRSEIPHKTLTASYMLSESTGYVHIRSFGETTYSELLIALADLTDAGAKNLVIDLRDNGGGYLQSAVQIANEFLSKGQLIVYTKGRKIKRHNYFADGHGSYKNMPLVVLINEYSASSSEILAGALQDNKRATIIGRSSFGKGLVQQEIAFSDKSTVRLTVARYYTPAGRFIQRPYVNGEFSGEGGGITPDLEVKVDTTDYTPYFEQAILSGLVQQFAFQYTDANRQVLKKFDTLHMLRAYLDRQDIVNQFVNYADKHDLKRRNLMINKSHALLERYVTSRIIYIMLSETAWTQYLNEGDPIVTQAIETLEHERTQPDN